MINKIRLNILKGAKPESFRFSSLNTQKITFAGFNKPRNQSKRIAAQLEDAIKALGSITSPQSLKYLGA